MLLSGIISCVRGTNVHLMNLAQLAILECTHKTMILKDLHSSQFIDVQKLVKFEHKVLSANWDEEGVWHLKIQTPEGSVIEDQADIMINAGGILK